MSDLPRAARTALLIVGVGVGVGGCGTAPAAGAGAPVSLRIAALDGGELETGSLRGRVVVLHLFDTGGVAAIADTAPLQALHRREPRRVAVIGVALDQSGYPVVAPWRRALGITYVVGLAAPGVRTGDSALGHIRTLPTTIVLDRDGRVVGRLEGQLEAGRLDALVDPLLGAPDPTSG